MSDLREWPQADRILDEALGLPRAERAAYLRQAADGDARLLAALELVVAEASSDDAFLEPGSAIASIGEAIDQPAVEATLARLHQPRRSAIWTLGSIAIGLILGAAAMTWLRPGPQPGAEPVSRLIVPLPPGAEAVPGAQPAVALSSDGRLLAYRGRRDGVSQLFLRPLDSLDARPVPGTENADAIFFSPDGRWLGFDADGELKRVSLNGGAPIPIAPASGNVTATWLPDESVVFSTSAGRVLQRVPSYGGEPVALTTLDSARGDTLHMLPQAVADGRAILFTIVSGAARQVAVFRLDSSRTDIIAEGTHGTYVPGGYVVFWRNGTLWGAPFDVGQLALSGRAAPLAEKIEQTGGTVLQFATSPAGSMVYVQAIAGGADSGRGPMTGDSVSRGDQHLAILGGRENAASVAQLVWVQHWVEDVRARVALVQ